MKLRTHLSDSTGKVIPASGWTTKSLSDDLNHDAMAAHALMQAMEEKAAEYSLSALALMIGPIKKRADELMREWTNQSEV